LSETGRAIPDKPDEFLTDLRSNLTAQPGCDSELLRILAEHILVSSPQNDCVARARRAIGQLAKARAESAQGTTPDA
jgi:hypothetical protein